MAHDPVLDVVPEERRAEARDALDRGDVRGFLGVVDPEQDRFLLLDNIKALGARGLYEEALFQVARPREKHVHIPVAHLRKLLEEANPLLLLNQGRRDVPRGDVLQLYRSVADGRTTRCLCHFYWTRDKERALDSARHCDRVDRCVYEMEVAPTWVRAYYTSPFDEEMFLVLIPSFARRPTRVVDVKPF